MARWLTPARVRRVAAVLMLLPALAASPPVAHACTCVVSKGGPPGSGVLRPEREALANADVAFVGTVVGGYGPSMGPPLGAEGSSGYVTWVLTVERATKGDVPSPQRILSPPNSGECGVEFQFWRRYAVYAYRTGTRLVAALCGGTHEIGGAPHAPELVAALAIATVQEDSVGAIGLAALAGLVLSGLWASRARQRGSGVEN